MKTYKSYLVYELLIHLLKRKIKEKLERDGKVLLKGSLPMSEVVKHLNIDIDYYKKIAEYQLKEQVVKTVL